MVVIDDIAKNDFYISWSQKPDWSGFRNENRKKESGDRKRCHTYLSKSFAVRGNRKMGAVTEGGYGFKGRVVLFSDG